MVILYYLGLSFFLVALGLLATTTVLGFLGNGNIILRYFRYPHLRTVYNTVILNIAVADFINTLAPIVIYSISPRIHTHLAAVACQVVVILSDAAAGVVGYSFCTLSAYHCWVLGGTLRNRIHSPVISFNKWCLVALLATWLLSIMISGVAAILEEQTCSVFPGDVKRKHLTTRIMFVAHVVIPFILIASRYSMLKLKTKRRARHHDSELAQFQKSATITALLILVYFLCKAPLIFVVVGYIHPVVLKVIYENLFLAAFLYFYLYRLDVCIRPIILHFFNQDYVLCCCTEKTEQPRRTYFYSDISREIDRRMVQQQWL